MNRLLFSGRKKKFFFSGDKFRGAIMEAYSVDKTLYEIGANDLDWDSDLDPVSCAFLLPYFCKNFDLCVIGLRESAVVDVS